MRGMLMTSTATRVQLTGRPLRKWEEMAAVSPFCGSQERGRARGEERRGEKS
jgi:hypothetical protein